MKYFNVSLFFLIFVYSIVYFVYFCVFPDVLQRTPTALPTHDIHEAVNL